MISPLHNQLPGLTPVCNLARSNSAPHHKASKLRFPHAGMGFALSHDRLPILSSPQMATNGRMSKTSAVFAAASPSRSFFSNPSERRSRSPMLVLHRASFNLTSRRLPSIFLSPPASCSLHQSARCILKAEVRRAAKCHYKSAFLVGTSGAVNSQRQPK